MNNLTKPSIFSGTKSLIIIFVTLIFSVALIVYGQQLIRRVSDTQMLWSNFDAKASQKTFLILQLEQSFGELGVPSSFKAFIDRQDNVQGAKVELHISNAQQAITQYQALDDISVTEAIALVKISGINENLQNSYLLASNLIATKNTEKLAELTGIFNQQEVNNALVLLRKETNRQQANSSNNASKQIKSTISYIAAGSVFLLLFFGYGIYILMLYRQNSVKHIELQRSSTHMTDLFHCAPQPTVVFDANGAIIEANDKATALFDATLVQLNSMQAQQLFCTADQQEFCDLRQQAVLNGKHNSDTRSKIINIMTRRGREVPVELSISMINNSQGHLGIIAFRNMSGQKRKLKLISENQLMLNQAQQISHIGSWNWELATDELIWSDEAYRIYGYKPQEMEVTNDTLMERIPPDERELVSNAINESVIFNKPYNITHHIVRVDGTRAIVEEHGKVIRDEENKAVRMIGIVRDITSLKHTEQQLELSANVFEHTIEAIVVTDADNNILKTNMAFQRISGFSNDEVKNKKLETILRANYFDNEFYQNIWQQLKSRDDWQGEIWNVRKNGAVYPTYQNISAIKNKKGDVVQYICIFSDISKHKLVEEQIREMANFDQLTLLPNRCAFVQRLKQTIEFSKQGDNLTAVFSITLNRPTHPNGPLEPNDQDQLISSTAKLITHLIRKQDSVMRSGHDEFSVIIRDLTIAEDAYIIAEKILKELTMPLALGQKKVVPGCSIGIAIHPVHSDNHNDLIKYADAAMSHAKAQSTSQSQVFKQELLDNYPDNRHQANELRRAIELKELCIHFEPQIDLSNYQLSAATAKILWNHPDRGVIPYSEFEEIAEQSKLVTPLFNWLLEEAIKQASQWSASTLGDTKIDIAISSSLLSSPGFSKTISHILTTYQLKPQRLQVEVTEQAILTYPDIAISELETVRDLGVKINFDQLGNNYSTLEDIKRIGFNSVTTMSGSLTEQQHSTDMFDKINKMITAVDSLPLNESISQTAILTSLKTITSVDDERQHHYLTGRELTQDELTEFSNALNVHNILMHRTSNNK